jgi:hypothetical protein
VAVFTEERRAGYNEGRQLAAQMWINGKAEARRIMNALADSSTVLALKWDDDSPYAQAYRKGFAIRMVERCEFYLSHADD